MDSSDEEADLAFYHKAIEEGYDNESLGCGTDPVQVCKQDYPNWGGKRRRLM